MSGRVRPTGKAGLVLVVLGLSLLAYWGLGQRPARGLEVFGDAPSFSLTDQLGRPLGSDQLRGRVVVANFVYTNCRESCPLLSSRMKVLQERLRQEGLLGTRVRLLSFTVDATQDSPEVLRAYAQRYGADPEAWSFLTGPEDAIQQLLEKGFFVGAQKAVPAAEQPIHVHEDGSIHVHEYDVMHSNRFILIDPRWRIRAYYDGLDLDIDSAMRDIRQLLGL